MKQLQPQPHPQHLRQGFSLFELMVVLAIMLLLAGFAAPEFMENVRIGRVIEAAEDARSVVASARLYAIEYGVDYHVRYEVGGNAAVAMPAEPGPQLSNNYSEDPTDNRKRLKAVILNEDLKFNALDGEAVGGESLDAADFQSLEEAGDFAQRTWSAPITFRPDGSASDATFRVMDEQGRQSEISVRGLTGAVRVTSVFTKDDE
jgi:prepilin-type N-terminal cleavage/methylation domain-containing protein